MNLSNGVHPNRHAFQGCSQKRVDQDQSRSAASALRDWSVWPPSAELGRAAASVRLKCAARQLIAFETGCPIDDIALVGPDFL